MFRELEEEIYRYLEENAVNRLNKMRKFLKTNYINVKPVMKLSDGEYAVIPWLSSNELYKLEYALVYLGYTVKNKDYYLIVKNVLSQKKLEKDIEELMGKEIQKEEISYPYGISIPNKYNEYIPQKLLEKEWIEDYLYG
ncbi:MAG: hypothetical protein IJA34_13360 [Lachnospiraceae bacterium]|nr:hypothetical protein [Lachnospiraceae bacterium]